jgi:hypothetical protein
MHRRLLVLALGALQCAWLLACPLSLEEYSMDWRECLPNCGSSDAVAATDRDAEPQRDVRTEADADGAVRDSSPDALDAGDGEACPDVAIGHVQATATSSGDDAGLVVSASYMQSQQACDLNVVVISWADMTHAVDQVTDTSSNRYQMATSPFSYSSTSDTITQVIYYAPGIAEATSNTVNVQFKSAGAPFVDVRILEYQGLHIANPLDVRATGSGYTDGSAGDLLASAMASTSTKFAPELVVAAGTTSWAFTDAGAGSGFFLEIHTASGNIVEDEILESMGKPSAAGVLRPHSQAWIMQLATFH